MNTILLLYLLQPYQHLLNQINEQESLYTHASFHYHLTSSYSFITLELLEADKQLYLRIRFELKDHKNILLDVYCEDKSRIPELNTLIHRSGINDIHWNEAANVSIYLNDSITKYLNIADAVAAKAMNCSSGDHYRPGYYSSVQITAQEILLSQVNHMNAKSLDHKNDYILRNFDIHIPLQGQTVPKHYDHCIGSMWMMLNDRSSTNNRSCGDAILEQINNEKAAFEK